MPETVRQNVYFTSFWVLPTPHSRGTKVKVAPFLKSNIDKTACLEDKVTIAQEETIPNVWHFTMLGK